MNHCWGWDPNDGMGVFGWKAQGEECYSLHRIDPEDEVNITGWYAWIAKHKDKWEVRWGMNYLRRNNIEELPAQLSHDEAKDTVLALVRMS
jgi:hypothetical protein